MNEDYRMKALTTAVVVTYNPNAVGLQTLLDALRPQVDRAVIVDNGSENLEEIRKLSDRFDCHLEACGRNIGVGAAQNRGIVTALREGASHVLLSDQDSVPAPDMVRQLAKCLEDACSGPSPLPVAAVGPVPVDERGDDEDALVYSFTTWGPKRRQIPGAGDVMEVPFVLASGCLIPRGALLDVGPMDESLFIDHIDLAWCMRAGDKGYRILVCGDARLTHSLGEAMERLPGGREVHVQAPTRNYYMVRNTLFLLRAPWMPARWKVGYLEYLVKYLAFYTLTSGRGERIPRMLRGVRDGILGRSGPDR